MRFEVSIGCTAIMPIRGFQQNVFMLSVSVVLVRGVESLARSGIGEIRLADLDDICVSNTNRQIHALSSTIGQSKIDVMAERCRSINPEITISCDHAFVTDKTVNSLIDPDLDLVIDCGDNQMAKAALISHCKRMKVPVITIGAAGGRIDPPKSRCVIWQKQMVMHCSRLCVKHSEIATDFHGGQGNAFR